MFSLRHVACNVPFPILNVSLLYLTWPNPSCYLLCCRDAVSDLAIHFLDKIRVMVVKDIEREDIEFVTKVRYWVNIITPTVLTALYIDSKLVCYSVLLDICCYGTQGSSQSSRKFASGPSFEPVHCLYL